MRDIQEVKDDLQRLYDEAQPLVYRAQETPHELTQADQKRFRSIESEMAKLEGELKTIEGFASFQERQDRFARGSAAQPHGLIRADNGSPTQDYAYADVTLDKRLIKEGRTWQAMCRATNEPFTMGGWTDDRSFFEAVRSGVHHPLLKRSQLEDIASQGGFLVPAMTAGRIMDQSLESEIVRPRARLFPMTSKELSVPAWDGEDHTSSTLYGGISAHWEGEGASLSTDEAKLRQLKLITKKLAFLGQASSELTEDSATFDREFRTILARAAGFFMDQAFLSGTGAGRPLGILNAPCLVTVSKETGQAAGTILHENVVKLWARCLPESRGRSFWIINNTVIPQLLSLHFAVGTGGVASPVYNQTTGEILKRPVIFSEKTPALGAKGDIILADFQAYAVGMRTQIALAVSPHVKFTTDELVFRLRVRLDGQPLLDAPVTPINGDTLSPFVTLEART